jgi:hypothetical protein
LLRLPRLSEDKKAGIDTFPDHLRWLWFLWSAKILGLLESSSEWEDRFSEDVRQVLRDSAFPFPKVERSEVQQFDTERVAQVAPVLRAAVFEDLEGLTTGPMQCTPAAASGTNCNANAIDA